jgi:pyruvate dehydrogenase E1 component
MAACSFSGELILPRIVCARLCAANARLQMQRTKSSAPAGNRPANDNARLLARAETRRVFDALEDFFATTLTSQEPESAALFLEKIVSRLREAGLEVPHTVQTPYVNTIPIEDQPAYPGDWQMEVKIKNLIRWNAMAMVVRANSHTNVGGHISSFASSATLYDVAFNNFFRGRHGEFNGDLVYFQGHASPGIYARAFLERRLDEKQLDNFRQELAEGGGLSSYPHPYLMPDFWQFPTVSMGLGPIGSIYQARFNRYLQARGFIKGEESKVWCFVGDGESDEPESLGSITLGSRENLDNLIWVINCNLQRLDGPVRGNGKIIQELEALFRGAGWNVIKVIWGSDWDDLIARDTTGLLLKRMEEAVDGDFQKYTVEPGSYIRKHFFGKYPELLPSSCAAATTRGRFMPLTRPPWSTRDRPRSFSRRPSRATASARRARAATFPTTRKR